jgi:hypothetical protein
MIRWNVIHAGEKMQTCVSVVVSSMKPQGLPSDQSKSFLCSRRRLTEEKYGVATRPRYFLLT